MSSIDSLLTQLRRNGAQPAAALCQALGVSQPTVSRLIDAAGERVLRFGQGRATRYAAARELFGAGYRQPLFRMDAEGNAERIATIQTASDGRYVVAVEVAEPWLLGNDDSGIFDGLPYFLDDLRPSGFLGRQLAKRLAADWGFPDDTRLWTEDQLGRWLLNHGEDAPGNLILGEGALSRARRQPANLVTSRADEYPALAALALTEGMPGSSAGGEQPKFTAWLRDAGQVIVKFSSAGRSPAAQRWRDLLRAEQLALQLLRERGLPAAQSEIMEFEGRVFLESRRFDRHGVAGRAPLLSLGNVDAEFAGEGQGWSRIAGALHGRALLSDASRETITWLEHFGRCIGNSDMHAGNLSLAPDGGGFHLLPVYDMLPMAFAPVRDEVPDTERILQGIISAFHTSDISVLKTAREYWARFAEDLRISPGFRSAIMPLARSLRKMPH